MTKALAIVVSVVIAGLLAVPFVSGGNSGTSSSSNTAHLYLYEKIEVSQDVWEVVEDGAWGKMMYCLSGSEFQYAFNGHHLKGDGVNTIGVSYSLIYYPDGWPGTGLIVLGSGMTEEELCPYEYYEGLGYLHLEGVVNTGDLPVSSDLNANEDTTTYDDGTTGAKIWLVLTADVDTGAHVMVGWNPGSYLFEGSLITFEDTAD